MNRFDVVVEVGLLVESLVVTQTTNVALDGFVRFGVISQFLSRPEGSLANIAGEVSLFGVGFPVGMQIAGRSKQFAADFTLIFPFIVVDSKVKLQISRLSESPMARLTLEGFLPGMNPLVSLQISTVVEGLSTDQALLWWFKQLAAFGHSNVLPQRSSLLENVHLRAFFL